VDSKGDHSLNKFIKILIRKHFNQPNNHKAKRPLNKTYNKC